MPLTMSCAPAVKEEIAEEAETASPAAPEPAAPEPAAPEPAAPGPAAPAAPAPATPVAPLEAGQGTPRKRRRGEPRFSPSSKKAGSPSGSQRSPGTHKRATSQLVYKLGGQKGAIDAYNTLSNTEKTDWINKFKVDKSLAWCEAWDTTKITRKRKIEGQAIWLTKSKLGGPRYLNDEEHAKGAVRRN